jgi:hypothetical protein
MVKKKLYYYSNAIALVMGVVFCVIAHGPIGVLIAIIAQVALGLLLLLGFIPVIGVILYAWLGWFSFLPWLTGVFGLTEGSWALAALFFFDLVISIGCTVQMLIRIFTTWWRIDNNPFK